MTTLATRIRARAQDLIARYGRAATYHEVTGRSYSTTTLTATETVAQHAVLVVMGYPKTKTYLPTDVVQSQAVPMFVDAASLTFVPKPGDRVEVGASTFTVTGVVEVAVQDSVALYELTTGA